MTNKDLFNGLNHIDEKIIEEAGSPVRHKKKSFRKFARVTHSLTTVAALLAVAILGTEVVRLNNRVGELESGTVIGQMQDTASDSIYAGIKSAEKMGEYVLATGYEDFYDTVKNAKKSSGDLNYGVSNDISFEESLLTDEVPKAESIQDNSISFEAATNDSSSGADNSSGADSSSGADNSSGADSSSGAGSPSKENGASHSTTNVMTEGVDESDIVKTDGNYIYMVESGQISITDIREGEPGEETDLIPEFDSPSDSIEELYVSDGNLLLITNHYSSKDERDETICLSYDITNPKEPELIGKARQDGYYKTSRKIGSTVYVFSNEYTTTSGLRKRKALLEENLAKWVPQVNNKVISYDCIYIEDEVSYGTLISSFDVNNPETAIDAKYVMNGSNEVYVSSDAMYFYASDWRSNRRITNISKMAFSNGIMEAGESTSVSGYLNDSFAINENKGFLYILATDNSSASEVNTLYVFDGKMRQVGVINEIARDELIYAARFVGNYAYFITYKQTDPLFVADISDPTDPKLLGELEVSGFSEYLHMWDDTHVLGIGYGDSARDTIKITMFDVSDPCNPIEEKYTLIDDYGYYCEAMNNYKAILADPGKNLIGFAADKYYLYSYDSENGFELVEKTTVKNENSEGYRGLYSDDDFYVAGNGEIKHFQLQ